MIQYELLSTEEKTRVLHGLYEKTINRLLDDEKTVIKDKGILELFEKNINRYTNVRSLKNSVEEAIYASLFDEYIDSGCASDMS